MATWDEVKSLIAQEQTVYLAIKPRYVSSWHEDLQDISKNSGVSIDAIKSLNPGMFPGAFIQNNYGYTPILINQGSGVGPGPGPDPTPGDYVFSLATNVCPLPNGSYYVSQEYGNGGHGGSDLACGNGTSVMAVQQGTVVTRQDWDGVTITGNMSWGNMIVLEHADSTGNVYYTLYAHNSSLLVNVGDYVAQGQQIALSGNSGNVGGSGGGYHLHLEVWVNGYGTAYRTNPRNYVPF